MIKSAGILLRSAGKYLVGHASGKGMTKGWGIPKGKLDKDESPLKAAIREFAEETNLDLETLDQNSLLLMSGVWHRFEVGKEKEVFVFRAFDISPEYVLQKFEFTCPSLVPNTQIPEIDAFKWVTAAEGVELATPSQKPMFEKLK